MAGTKIVEIGTGSVAECSRRILAALGRRSLAALKQELVRAGRVAQQRGIAESRIEEQAELLEAIVGSISLSITGHRPSIDAEISLLGHLARA